MVSRWISSSAYGVWTGVWYRSMDESWGAGEATLFRSAVVRRSINPTIAPPIRAASIPTNPSVLCMASPPGPCGPQFHDPSTFRLALYNSSARLRSADPHTHPTGCLTTPERKGPPHNRSANTLPVGRGLLHLLRCQGRPRPARRCARPARRLGRRRHDVAKCCSVGARALRLEIEILWRPGCCGCVIGRGDQDWAKRCQCAVLRPCRPAVRPKFGPGPNHCWARWWGSDRNKLR